MYTASTFFFTLTICAIVVAVTATDAINPLSDEFIDLINKERKWLAGRNFHPDTPIQYIKDLLGVSKMDIKYSDYKNVPVIKHELELIESLPDTFDPRKKWPGCPSLNEIRDQGRCGSCWAFGAVEAMTDRVCIQSNGTKNFNFSAEDLLTCSKEIHGCSGGNPTMAWEEWVEQGLVSGGNYNSHEGCKPYSIPTCLNHMINCTTHVDTPSCHLSCEKGYNISYEADKKRGKNFYFVETKVDNIMAELYKNGPVETIFVVYEDFANYKSGVYKHLKGDVLGGHAVKMMGWGVENGTKYWLIANSWNTDFGENGFFKIWRGVNECSIERFVLAGEPLLKDY